MARATGKAMDAATGKVTARAMAKATAKVMGKVTGSLLWPRQISNRMHVAGKRLRTGHMCLRMKEISQAKLEAGASHPAGHGLHVQFT
jgi:hypothetical protein